MHSARYGDLAPCPKCNGDSLRVVVTPEPGDPHAYTYAVKCLGCGFMAPPTHLATEAAPIWNSRLKERQGLTCLGCVHEPKAWRRLRSRPGNRLYGLCQQREWSCGLKMVILDTKTGRLFCHRRARGREERPMFINEFSICRERRPRKEEANGKAQ